MTSPQQTEAAAAIAAYTRQTLSLRANLIAFIQRLWRSIGVYRTPARFVQQAVPAVTGAQQQMAALTAAYLARQRQIAIGGLGTPTALSDRSLTGSATRNGTPLAEVYERPFHTLWRQLDQLPHEPGSIDQAIKAGLDQAVTSAATDLQRTKALTSQTVVAGDRHIIAYARVLEGAHSCGLCIVASTQRYHVKELLPIHPGCDCAVAPIYGDEDPGQVINEHLLGEIHDAIAAQFGSSNSGARYIKGQVTVDGKPLRYRDVLITHQHGELGPILAVRGQEFTGPSDLT